MTKKVRNQEPARNLVFSQKPNTSRISSGCRFFNYRTAVKVVDRGTNLLPPGYAATTTPWFIERSFSIALRMISKA